MGSCFDNKDNITPIKRITSIKVFGNDCVEDGMNPFFTIAIPTYNRPTTLAETINSALIQERYNNYEIIVVDNNPERGDETELFMQKYSSHPKIAYYKNAENVGMSGNWNKCIILAKSNNVILLHDDDIISPFALSIFGRVLKEIRDNWCFVKPNLFRFIESRDLLLSNGNEFSLRRLSLLDFSFGCPVGAPSCMLFNKTSYLKVGGANDDYFPCVDYSLNLRLCRLGNSYLLGGECLGGYRVADNESLKESTMDKYFIERYRISDSVLKALHVPGRLRGMIQAAMIERQVETVKSYYNLEDYQYKYSSFPAIKMSAWGKCIISNLYELVMKINYKVSFKRISIV